MKQTPRFILKSGFIALLTIYLSVVGSPWSRASVDRARQTSESTGVLSSLKAPPYQSQWHLAALGVPKALPLPARPVVVAIVDTGLDDSHPALRGRVLPGWNVITPGKPPRDEHGHGTHVAGLIGRIVPTVQLLPVKVANTTGFAEVADVVQGIMWAAEQGADIIYVGLGTDQDQDILREAVTYARSTGAIVVAPSGDTPSQLMYPAAYDHVIAVSSLDHDDIPVESQPQGSRGVFAPGVRLLSAKLGGGYTYKSGSSGAAALGAAALALARAARPDLNSEQLVSLLFATAQRVRVSSKGSTGGWGKLRADRYLQSLATVSEDSLPARASFPRDNFHKEFPRRTSVQAENTAPVSISQPPRFSASPGTTRLMRVYYNELNHPDLAWLSMEGLLETYPGEFDELWTADTLDLSPLGLNIWRAAREEDCCGNFFNHFMHGKTGEKLITVDSSNVDALTWAKGGNGSTPYSWDNAIQLYNGDLKAEAYEALGHPLHLLQDMAQPAHTHLDPHPGAAFESMVKENFDNWIPSSPQERANILPIVSVNSLDDAFKALALLSYEANRFDWYELHRMFDLRLDDNEPPPAGTFNKIYNKSEFGGEIVADDNISILAPDDFWETRKENPDKDADEPGFFYIENPDKAFPAEYRSRLTGLTHQNDPQNPKTLTEFIARDLLVLSSLNFVML